MIRLFTRTRSAFASRLASLLIVLMIAGAGANRVGVQAHKAFASGLHEAPALTLYFAGDFSFKAQALDATAPLQAWVLNPDPHLVVAEQVAPVLVARLSHLMCRHVICPHAP